MVGRGVGIYLKKNKKKQKTNNLLKCLVRISGIPMFPVKP